MADSMQRTGSRRRDVEAVVVDECGGRNAPGASSAATMIGCAPAASARRQLPHASGRRADRVVGGTADECQAVRLCHLDHGDAAVKAPRRLYRFAERPGYNGASIGPAKDVKQTFATVGKGNLVPLMSERAAGTADGRRHLGSGDRAGNSSTAATTFTAAALACGRRVDATSRPRRRCPGWKRIAITSRGRTIARPR